MSVQELSVEIAFCRAITLGDIEQVQIILGSNLDPNFCLGGSYREDTEILKQMKTEGFDLSDCLNEYGQHNNSCSPLTLAVIHNHLDIVLILLDHGAHIDVADDDWKQTPLFESLLDNVDISILEALLRRGCAINHRDILGRTPLHFAGLALGSDSGNYLKFTKLLEAGADINIVDGYGATILHNWDVMHKLIHEEISPAGQLCGTLLELIFKHGGETIVNATNKEQTMPLHMAVKAGCYTAVRLLLEHGASVHAKDMDHFVPLMHLAFSTDEQSFQGILDILLKSIDINTLTVNHETILFGITDAGSLPENIKYTVHQGADVEHRDNEGKTPLRAIIENGKDGQTGIDIVSILLESGSDINTQANDGRTPLHCAVLLNKPMFIKHLLDNGCEVGRTTHRHESVLHFATKNMELDYKSFLLMSDVNGRDIFGSTPLHWAVWFKNQRAALELVKAGADRTVQDCMGQTVDDMTNALHCPSIHQVHSSETTESNAVICEQEHWLDVCKELKDADNSTWETHIMSHIHQITRYSNIVLNSRHMGMYYDVQENTAVVDEILKVVKDSMVLIHSLEPLFDAEVILAGSTAEGTKCGVPDEIDMVLHLKKFTEAFIPVRSAQTPPGYTMLKLKQPSLSNTFRRFMVGDILDSSLVTDYFYVLLDQVMIEFTSTKQKHIDILKHVQFNRFSISFMHFMWTGRVFKQMTISVDLVPSVLCVDLSQCSLPDGPLTTLDLSSVPLFTVLRTIKDEEDFSRRCHSFRVSTASWERKLMTSLHINIKRAYILTKALLIYSPFSTQAHRYDDYLLALILNGKVVSISDFEPLEMIQQCTTYSDSMEPDDSTKKEATAEQNTQKVDSDDSSAFVGVDTNDENNVADDAQHNETKCGDQKYNTDNELSKKNQNDQSGMHTSFTEDTEMGSQSMDGVSGEPSKSQPHAVFDMLEKEDQQMNETSLYSEEYSTYNNSTITSYMIKSTFFHVIDEVLRANDEALSSLCGMSQEDPHVTFYWARKICEKFLQFVKEKNLSPYFMPDVNLFTDEFGKHTYDLDILEVSIQRLQILLHLAETENYGGL